MKIDTSTEEGFIEYCKLYGQNKDMQGTSLPVPTNKKQEAIIESAKKMRQWKAEGRDLETLTDEELDAFYFEPSMISNLDPLANYLGVYVPLEDVLNKEYLTIERILKEPNMEVRRVLIDLVGIENFVRRGGVVPVTEEDSRGYQVVKIPLDEDDTDWYFLKMVNSTAEKDNITDSYREKIYYARIPGELVDENLTTQKAVAWTFPNTKVKEGAIYQNNTNKFLKAVENSNYCFEKDKRQFTKQGRQGDVYIRLLADSLKDLKKGKLHTKDGYDPYEYAPEVES